MEPVDQIILSLREEPEAWLQEKHTLNNNERSIQIWTANVPFLDTGIHAPIRKISFFDKIKLQLAVYEWHRKPLDFTSKS